jgi:hypothetical protein
MAGFCWTERDAEDRYQDTDSGAEQGKCAVKGGGERRAEDCLGNRCSIP